MKKVIVLATILTVTAGCSTIAEKQAELAIDAQEHHAEQLEESVDSVPEWFLDVPKPDATGIYGVGFGEANKVHYALNLSELRAKFDLASQIKQVFTGQERSFEQLNANSEVVGRSTSLIDSIVDRVELSGIERVKREVFVVGTKVHSYTLLKMQYGQYNKLLNKAQALESNSSMNAAFEKMYSRINEQRGLAPTK